MLPVGGGATPTNGRGSTPPPSGSLLGVATSEISTGPVGHRESTIPQGLGSKAFAALDPLPANGGSGGNGAAHWCVEEGLPEGRASGVAHCRSATLRYLRRCRYPRRLQERHPCQRLRTCQSLAWRDKFATFRAYRHV